MSESGIYSWLDKLKVGDPVVIADSSLDGAKRAISLGNVEEISLLHVRVNGLRYRRCSGLIVGSIRHDAPCILEATAARLSILAGFTAREAHLERREVWKREVREHTAEFREISALMKFAGIDPVEFLDWLNGAPKL